MTRIDIKQIKQIVENEGSCKLLSKEFVNYKTKLLFECSCGKTFETTWDKFKFRNKRQCNVCSRTNQARKRKNSYADVKKFFNELGYELIDKEYKNNSSKISLKDEQGYMYYTTYSTLNKKGNTRKIHKSNPYSIHNIKNWLKINDLPYILKSTEFKGNGSQVNTRDLCKLDWICPEGHNFKVTWNDFNNGTRCSVCNPRSKTHDKFIQDVTRKYGDEYTVLTKYTRSKDYVLVRHNICGTEWMVKPNNLLHGYGCPNNNCCKSKGKNHYKWNENLTEEEREHNYSRHTEKEYRLWKIEVFKKYGRKCGICGVKHCNSNKLIPHHLNSWDMHKEQRYDVDNGFAICEKHHKEFHNQYGYGKNKKEQFEEFKKIKNQNKIIY